MNDLATNPAPPFTLVGGMVRTLRYYQRDCIDFMTRALFEATGRTYAVIMPTGAGKTYTIVSLFAELFVVYGEAFPSVLVVAPQVAIVEAWQREVCAAGLPESRFRVITHAAALNLLASEIVALGAYIVVDEAQHARDLEEDSTGIGAFANYCHAEGKTVLFATATPFMNGRSSLPTGTVRWSRSIAEHSLPDPATGEQYMPGRVQMVVVYVPIEDEGDDAFIADLVSAWVERWRIDGRQKSVFIVPSHLPGGSRRFAAELIAAIRVSTPSARVQNCVGSEGSVKRSTLQALERESRITRYADSRVDVMVSAARFNEGTDWRFASAVYRYGISSSFTLNMQQAGRGFRQKLDDHPSRDVATFCCFVPTLPGDTLAAWENYYRDAVCLLVAHLENGDTGQAYVTAVQRPVRKKLDDESGDNPFEKVSKSESGLGDSEGGTCDGTGASGDGAPGGNPLPGKKIRKRFIVRPDMRGKFATARSEFLYEDPEFMRVRAEVQAGRVTGTSAQRMEWLLRSQLDGVDAVQWRGARWEPKTPEQWEAYAAKQAAAREARTPEQRAVIAAKSAAAVAARTPEQRADYAAKVAAVAAARTPEQRAAIVAKMAAKVATRTPEQQAEILAKKAATRAARTPEERLKHAAKLAAVVAARTPEQRAAYAAKRAAMAVARSPEQQAETLARRAATRAMRTPEQRAEYAAKRAATAAARTPEQRTNIAVTWARVVAIRTPELRAEILAKKLATRAAWTEERRASYRAKMAAVVAAHTPEQRAATEAKKAATRAKRAPEQHAVIEAKKAATRAKRAELRVLDSMIQAPCVATEPDCVAMESEQAASP